MGLYALISDYELKNWVSVEDPELNTLFKEAKKLEPNLLITEQKLIKKRWFKDNETIYRYTLYLSDQGTYQAREILCAYGEKRVTMAYLYGLINGINKK